MGLGQSMGHAKFEHLTQTRTVYRRLSEFERELSHTRTQLQEAQEEIDIRTHAIVHLEHTIEQQDAELEERVE
jgi:chromosome segregation ATPase